MGILLPQNVTNVSTRSFLPFGNFHCRIAQTLNLNSCTNLAIRATDLVQRERERAQRAVEVGNGCTTFAKFRDELVQVSKSRFRPRTRT